jgi:DNA-binding transcriptional LysR family regulator
MATQGAVGDLEFGLLRTFLAVVRLGSLGKTAAACKMTQPAVSQQVIRLERIVGQRLFARGRSGMTLTRHGDLLVSYAHRAVKLNEETLARLGAENGPEGIALGMTSDVGFAGLVPALKRFQSGPAKLDLRVVVGALPRLEALLNGGQLDLIIGDPGLISGHLAAEYSVPLAWAACENLCIDKSRPIPLILFENPRSWQDEMLDCLRAAGWNWRVIFESASVDAIVAAVRSGLGMAALSPASMGDAQLVCVQTASLPPPPKIRLGLFRSQASPKPLHAMLESALAAVFSLKSQ